MIPNTPSASADSIARRAAVSVARAIAARFALLRVALSPLGAAAALFAAGDAAWIAVRDLGPHTSLVANLVSLPMVFAAAWATWATGRRCGTAAARGWRLIAAGTLSYALGNVVWLVKENVLGQPGANGAVGLADVLTLAYYPLLLAGLHALARPPRGSRREGGRFWLDMSAVLLAGGAVVWSLVLGPASGGDHGLATLVRLAYPAASLALLTGAAALLLRQSDEARPRRIMLELAASAALLTFVADLGCSWLALQPGGYVSGSWPHLVYTAAALLWVLVAEFERRTAAAPEAPRAAPVDDLDGGAVARPRGSLLPYLAVAAVYALLLRDHAHQWSPATSASLLVAGALAVIVIARQVVAVRESGRLFALLAEREARFRAIFDQSPTGIVLLGRRGAIEETNVAFQRLLGYSRDELRALGTDALSPPEDVERTRHAIAALRAGGPASVSIEKRYLHRDGGTLWASVTLARATTGGRAGLLGIVQDVTERKRLEAELLHQALHDALTGLANRALFRDRVTHALARSAREGGGTVAALFLDLDGFKQVNDSFGHDAGDLLLAEVARRLRAATRECDTVARLGGDEFALLVEDVSDDTAALAAAERVLGALCAPVRVRGRDVHVAGSVGVARAVPGEGPEELLRNADVAMYQAKQAGKGRVALFAPAMHAAVVERLELEGDLRAALERHAAGEDGGLRVVYQPVVDLPTGAVRACEALARWTHPRRGAVSPGVFIPVAEESGLVSALGRHVLRAACREAAGWGAPADASAPAVSVNLSGHQLGEPTLLDDVRAALADAGLEPSRLTLEITESAIMRDSALETLHALKALGVRLAVDDFGTGYSSLSQLQRFPVDVLKIDKAFVDDVARGGSAAALARTVIALGVTLGLRTVAEGIEHAEQADALRRLGCDLGQGYHFARPMPPDALRRAFAAASVAAAPA